MLMTFLTELFSDAPGTDYNSQHANVMAILTDAIPARQQADFISRIIIETSLIQPATYFQFFNTQALRKSGLGDRYIESSGAWRNMVRQELSKFAEWEIEPRSDCHAWSAGPDYYFLSLVTGIIPAATGFKRVRVQPAPGTLTKVDSCMPHPLGDIPVRLERIGKTG